MNQALHAICFSAGITRQKFWQQVLGVTSLRCISARNYRLAQSLGLEKQLFKEPAADLAVNSIVVDWGNKRQVLAEEYAQTTSLPLLRLEDGFIRSISAPVTSATATDKYASKPFSLIIDDLGVYYDASRPSRLEHWLNYGASADAPAYPHHAVTAFSAGLPSTFNSAMDLDEAGLLARARACIDIITESHLSKYNDLHDIDLGPKKRYRLLLVDQLVNDLSIVGGAATPASFEAMLDQALSRFPDADIIIKTHPVANKNRCGHFDLELVNKQLKAHAQFKGSVQLLTTPSNALALIKQVDEVFVVSSQVGFEALMLGKKVSCFGLPFYAGWGLTEDKQPIARRQTRRSLEQVFAAAYFMYSHYRDPFTGKICQLEDLLVFLQHQRNMFQSNRGVNLCLGFPPWKHAYLRRFLYSPWGRVKFVKSERALLRRLASTRSDAMDADCSARVLLWGDTAKTESLRSRLAPNNSVVQIEDGFIRSVGLGKYYIPPRALVFDGEGIYFNPKTASGLERILSTNVFSAEQLASADRMMALLKSAGITKYNVGGGALPPALLAAKLAGQIIVLVPGQVEEDASIKTACKDIASDMDLLKQVRLLRAEAVIIYKPHPDVVSGNCVNASTLNKAAEVSVLADYVLTEIDMESCLAVADEVHVMTSLTGFEAIIRGVPVFTYGLPFYAGWGLTIDYLTCSRRQRQLNVNELLAGVLLCYSRYIDYRSGYFISAEQALALIIRDMELIVQDKQFGSDGKQKAGRQGAVKANTVYGNTVYANSVYAGKSQRFILKIKNLMRSILYGLRH